MEESKREQIAHLTEAIEGYVENWDGHDSHQDFEQFEVIYEKLCELIGKQPKDLAKLAYPEV